MKHIKFRAYIPNLKWIVPVERIYFDVGTVEVDLTDGNGDTAEYYYGEVELMQYTGLKDKNGKEIYEGDVLGRNGYWNYYIGFEEGCFVTIPTDLVQRNNFSWLPIKKSIFENVEVIGNIYENPELLS